MDDYLAKPMRFGTLLEKLANVLKMGSGQSVAMASAGQSPSLTESLTESLANADDSPLEATETIQTGTESTESTLSDEGQSSDHSIAWPQARQAVGGDETLLRDLLRAYLGETNSLLNGVRRAVQKQDQNEILRAVHTYKGASLSVGAIRVYELAREIETALVAGDLGGVEQIYDRLRSASDQVVAEAEAFLATDD
jgi:HPt (histidine-containing phosphotransfer) domain-containing protein